LYRLLHLAIQPCRILKDTFRTPCSANAQLYHD
jgi:hypothetical protein